MSDPTTCPLCGEPNRCGIAEGRTECWCFTTSVPDEVLARIPADDRNERCVCARCAAAATTATPPEARE